MGRKSRGQRSWRGAVEGKAWAVWVPSLKETTMSCSLPPEILDLIVDHLHDELTALKACCLVSKSWVPRTRNHLFALVEFRAAELPIERWKKNFPDPSNSPAHHTHTLYIHYLPTLTAADTDVGGWIRTFHNVVNLHFERITWESHRSPLVSFHGLSPTIRSLSLTCTSFEVFDIICSFPLLEDLTLVLMARGAADGWTAPLTSPKLTGSLNLIPQTGGIGPAARRLLALPGGLHFAKIRVSCRGEADAGAIRDLVSSCSDTLESLSISCFLEGGFHSVSVIGWYLTVARKRRQVDGTTLPRPLHGHKTQICDVFLQRIEDPAGHHCQGRPQRSL